MDGFETKRARCGKETGDMRLVEWCRAARIETVNIRRVEFDGKR